MSPGGYDRRGGRSISARPVSISGAVARPGESEGESRGEEDGGREAPDRVLPELLAPGLRVVFVGSAAGRVSARRGAYYAGPGNRFWPILAETGLTPRLFAPEAFPALLPLGIGLSDVNARQSGADSSLDPAADDPFGLEVRLRAVRPAIVAFNGKRPAAAALGRPSRGLRFGKQAEDWAGAACWVLPSTSGLAVRWWDPAPWRDLAAAARG